MYATTPANAALPDDFPGVDRAIRAFDFQGAHALLAKPVPSNAEETPT